MTPSLDPRIEQAIEAIEQAVGAYRHEWPRGELRQILSTLVEDKLREQKEQLDDDWSWAMKDAMDGDC